MKHKLESRFPGEISVTSDMLREEELKSLLMKVKEESEKAGLKSNLNQEGNGNPLQYSCLEKSMDRGVWRAEVHGIT